MTEDEAIDKLLAWLYDKPKKEDAGAFCDYQLKYPTDGYIHLARKMVSEDLVERDSKTIELLIITSHGREVVKKGGYLKYLKDQAREEEQNKKREQLELNLAESNIEANKLNRKIAKRNKIETRVNVAIGILNLIILIVQLWLAVWPIE